MKTVFMRGGAEDFPNYVAALEAVGLVPVRSMDLAESDAADALLVPGGADVNPAVYGQENAASEGIDDARDRDEIELVRRFLAAEKPIFGICRGHQVVNVALGGDLIQHVENAERHRATPEGDRVHPVTAVHPLLKDIYGETFPVNSAHHQAVDKIGEGLVPLCYSDDGLLEGAVHENGRVLTVQFHPERIAYAHRRADAVDGARLFELFASWISEP